MNSHERRRPDHPLRRAKDYRPDGTRVRRWSNPERAFRLSYRSRPLITLALVALAILLLPATVVVAATTVVSASKHPEGKKAGIDALDWNWSDSNSAEDRVFNSGDFTSANALPRIKVHAPPGQTGLLYLEFLQDGEWNAEWVTKPDALGNATIPIDPYCANSSWCDGSYKYRVKMPGLVSYVSIEYWDT